MFPTGTKGVLYRPHFFHPVVFSSTLRNLTGTYDDKRCSLNTKCCLETADDLAFRLSCLPNKVPVVRSCHEIGEGGVIIQSCAPANWEVLRRSALHTQAAVAKVQYKTRPTAFVETPITTSAAIDRTIHRKLIELWKHNIDGGNNDRQLRAAIDFMKAQGVIPSFESILRQYYDERSPHCYEERYVNRRSCSIFNCLINPANLTKPVQVIGNVTW